MKFKIALLIGRFQPFHLGHLYLLKKTLEIAEKVVVGIGSASIYDENNPLDYDTRRKVIKAVFYKEKIEDRLLGVVPLEDFFNDKKWLENVKNKVGRFDVIVSNNDWTNDIMEKAGYKVVREPYFKRNLYEGWRIRELIEVGKQWQNRVPNYLVKLFSTSLERYSSSERSGSRNNLFKHIVLGGTFDHFHKGHEELIKTAFKYGKKVTIGIATEELYKDKLFSNTIESFEERKKSVSDFIRKNKWLKKAKIISFSGFTGGVDKRDDVDAIVVSRYTYLNALKINELRERNGFKPLRIIIIKNVLAEDGKLLSSERIRAGEIDRSGKRYTLYATRYTTNELNLPDKMREELRKPLGRVFKNIEELLQCFKTLKWTKIIAVGDIIVDSLIKNGIDPDVKIIDFKTRREQFPISNFQFPLNFQLPKEKFLNKPGTINLKTAEKLREIIRHPTGDEAKNWLIVNGEEDLLTLPAILFAPLGSLVLYGHWQYGIIAVEVTENTKAKIDKIIRQFH